MRSTGRRFGVILVSYTTMVPVSYRLTFLVVVRIQFAAPHGILAASLVINRRLYKIASTSSVSSSRAERRRVILTDLAIGLSIPILTIVLCKSQLRSRNFLS